MAETREINLYGRIVISGVLEAITGLHIGRGKEGVMIGGVDNPVLRDPVTGQPYIPGSSIKGKLRSLAEKREPTVIPNKNIGRRDYPVYIHVCQSESEYRKCPVCPIYGVAGESGALAPTRLVVRDCFLTPASASTLRLLETDQPYTEIKSEVSIDRVTSASNPRSLERVPAGAEFGPLELVYSVYEAGDIDRLQKLFEAMNLLQDDYLGGGGSRGSGKIAFKNLQVEIKPVKTYGDEKPELTSFPAAAGESLPNITALLGQLSAIQKEARSQLINQR